MRSFNVDNKLKDRETIKRAIVKVCKNKKKKKKGSNRKYELAQKILKNQDKYVDEILEMILAFEKMMKAHEEGKEVELEILEKAYKPKKCPTFITRDGHRKKTRAITGVPLFPDQIIQQIIIEVSEPIFLKESYEYSCGSIPGRGTHKGVKYLKKVIKRHRKHDKSAIKYAAQLDITKCYPNISHTYLKKRLRRKFRGKLFIWLSFAIIDSYHDYERNGEYFGLAIGYPISQGFSNFVLTPLDHFIKEDLGIEYYVRYMDDMIMFCRNKKQLHKAVRAIAEHLNSIDMKIKDNWQVFRFDYINKQGERKGRALDTLGYRFFRDKVILRKSLALTIRRQVKRVSKMSKITPHVAKSLMSRLGWLRHCNSYNFYHKYVKPLINIKKIKEVIRNESRKHNQACCAV